MTLSDGATAVALTSIRTVAYCALGATLFYLAMFIGKWYEAELPGEELGFMLKGDLEIRSSYVEKFLWIGMPIVVAAALGGLYEAIWKQREVKTIDTSESEGVSKTPGFIHTLQSIIHLKFRPLGQNAPWLTVGEATVLFLWIMAMGSQCWQGVMNHGNHYHDRNARCVDDPSKWCNMETQEEYMTPDQYRYRMIGVFMGLVATAHFAVILVPVSRDSKIWSAVGIPFERAVLYHAIAGHLAFFTTFLHAFLMVSHWVNYDGWSHAWHESVNVDHETHGGVDTPMGWMAFICAMPMWITSTNYVRRRWYSLFKLTHWMFIGVFVFSVMHYAPNALYFLGGLALYTMHVMSRLESWKRWRYWNRWLKPETKASPTSLVNVLTNRSYTRLVLRAPKSEPARGGTFVYISAPGVLGTDEAHAITVALRGSPPSSAPIKSSSLQQLKTATPEEDVFTIYIKDLGPWTHALKVAAKGAEVTSPESLLVDVDGFYNHAESFNSMMKDEGAGRVLVIAGGSGMTSLMGFIQDWCVAAAAGAKVPEVHVSWCCRDMDEMELVGESIPSMLESAGTAKDTHFSMSLYCSGKSGANEGALSVTWPLDRSMYAMSSTKGHVIGNNSVASSLNHSVRVIIAGLAAWAGFLLGMYEMDRRNYDRLYHEGAIIFVLMIVCIVSSLIVYDWLASLVQKYVLKSDPSSAQVAGRRNGAEESKVDLESTTMGGNVNYAVGHGRVPTRQLLMQEADMAKKNGVQKVKVLVSGPNSLVDTVLAESRSVDWQLFETEAFSFEF